MGRQELVGLNLPDAARQPGKIISDWSRIMMWDDRILAWFWFIDQATIVLMFSACGIGYGLPLARALGFVLLNPRAGARSRSME